MNNFFNFKEIGVLEVDKVFFESYYPILFTCINERKELFLCVCCQADSKIRKWLVTNVSPKTIIELLSNKVTIRESFLKGKGLKYTIIYDVENKSYKIEEENAEDWNAETSVDLPTVGEYMEAEEDEFAEEIEYFRNLEIQYFNQIYEMDTKKSNIKVSYKTNPYETDFIVESYSNNSYDVKIVVEMKNLSEKARYSDLQYIRVKYQLSVNILSKLRDEKTNKAFNYSINDFNSSKYSIDNLLKNLGLQESICINNTLNIVDAA